MTGGAIGVTLPHGLCAAGARHQDAMLRPLTGADQALLAEAGTEPPARLVTVLLGRTVTRIGAIAPVGPDVARALTIGDREALLLHLWRISRGDRLDCVLVCPHGGCGERMDLELSASRLALPAYEHARPEHEVLIDGPAERYRVTFRLPNGGDQEEAAEIVLSDGPGPAAAAALRRTILAITPSDGARRDRLPELVARRLPTVMADLDPQAEITLDLTCPACGRGFATIFDTASFLLSELAAATRRLFREVHWLALNYHWSERAILALSLPRRRLYLDLLDEASAGGVA